MQKSTRGRVKTLQNSRSLLFFDDLIRNDVLKPLPGMIEGATIEQNNEDFMAPNGINSVVKYFFSSSDAKIKLNTFCREINLTCQNKETSKHVWTVTTKDGNSEEFNGVILTIPVPQILQLNGTFQDVLKNYQSELQQVEYSSRYALALFFPEDTKLNVSWIAKYVKDNPCIRFVSLDSVKRGFDSSTSGLSILIHTSVPFGLANLESDIGEVENIIYQHFQELFPSLPPPTSTRCIRWRYSQVYKSYPGQPGALDVSTKPLLVLAGDCFVHSNFSGCVESANAVLKILQKELKSSNTCQSSNI
ncbi:renalase-like isoform X2 [Dendronephthya gigantea]|uniref:renalase-like isoform X2 n=1 Tax=Dendronephthya gigantea TaxID=151771 RepID=UPI00106B134A|nr:renalase-like isoform X2 [Dendronephthya gigantea]